MARLALLAAMCSSTALAQENATSLGDPHVDYAAYLPDAPPTELVDTETAATTRHGARLTYELLGATAGLGLSIALAAGVGSAVGGESFNPTKTCEEQLELCSPGGFTGFVLYAISSPFLAAAGVAIAGNASGANGGYAGAIIGALLGSSLGWLSFAKLDDGNFGRALQPVLTVAGSMIGYEIARVLRAPSAAGDTRVMPTASASPEGFTLGITGRI